MCYGLNEWCSQEICVSIRKMSIDSFTNKKEEQLLVENGC